MSLPAKRCSKEASRFVADCAGIGWNGVKKPSGTNDAAASAVATVPALRSYCTDAEIGGSTNRPIEPRQTVSGFCAYANEKRGSRNCSVYVEGETSVNCVPMCWNPAGHVVENTAFAGGGLVGPSGAVVTSSVAGS